MNPNPRKKGIQKLLIIHTGADKCASSSLQQSLGELNKYCPELQNFHFLKNNSLVKRNDNESEKKNKITAIKKIFEERSSDTIIVSNEGLIGESLPSLPLLCKIAIEDYCFNKVLITMYSRSPASHAISSYHQWHFRNRETLKNDINISERAGFNSDLLSPLERRLIAMTSKHQYRNWNNIIQNIKNKISQFGEKVELLSQHIPTKRSKYSLLNHFFESTMIKERYKNIQLSKFDKRSNERFSDELTHAISIMLCEDRYSGSFIPGPHESNQFLHSLSLVLKSAKNNSKEDLNEAYENCQDTLDFLSFTLDELAREGSMRYCEEFGIEPCLFFHLASQNSITTIEHIKEISAARDKNSISDYNNDCICRVSKAYKKLSNHAPWMKLAKKLT